MLCPKCRTEMRIQRVSTVVEGDSSSDTPTRVYRVQRLICRNDGCSCCGEEMAQVKNLIYDGGESGA